MHSTGEASQPAKRLNKRSVSTPPNPLALSPLPMIMSIWNTSRLQKEADRERDRKDAIIAEQQKKIRAANLKIWNKNHLIVGGNPNRKKRERDAPAYNKGLFKADGATMKVWNYLRAVDEPGGLTVHEIHLVIDVGLQNIRQALGVLVENRIVERIGDENTRMGNGNTGFRLRYKLAADSNKELTTDRSALIPVLD